MDALPPPSVRLLGSNCLIVALPFKPRRFDLPRQNNSSLSLSGNESRYSFQFLLKSTEPSKRRCMTCPVARRRNKTRRPLLKTDCGQTRSYIGTKEAVAHPPDGCFGPKRPTCNFFYTLIFHHQCH